MSYNLITSVGDNPYIYVKLGGIKKLSSVYNSRYVTSLVKHNNFKIVSEYKQKGCDFHINLNSNKFINKSLFNSKEINDIISGCRGLRKIKYESSKKIIKKAEFAISRFIEEKPSFVLFPSVDNYFLDIFYRYLLNSRINFLPVTNSPLSPKYSLSTSRGEYFINNKLGPSLKSVKAKLLSRKKSQIAPNIFKGYFNSLYIIFKNPIYLYRFLLHKAFNLNEFEYYFSLYFIQYSQPNIALITKKYLNLNQIKHISKISKIAYFPINVYPESTIDYWTELTKYSNYDEIMFNLISLINKEGYTVIIKAHPFFVLHVPSLITSFDKNKNIHIASPNIEGLSIIENSNLVIQPSGTSIFQAMLMRKKVIACKESPYTINLNSSKNHKIDLPEPFLLYDSKDNPDYKKYLSPWSESHL